MKNPVPRTGGWGGGEERGRGEGGGIGGEERGRGKWGGKGEG